ncbi:aldolase [Stutzerimonas stutzeri]|uniref:HpcH/HpaI aldolase family protein n=1 Tax=Stutzerimonas stutzeri TaxID=316 RepID=UPI000F7B575F|nr:aldolase/citrate lyase family protein [Stutzerimonas stutzeri]MDH0727297.1 aldolase/citrate lyase family protein [Stutzerimonas stutzeri]RRV61238.1 aldolase [Stutzerimonas stutzeri]RRV74042.1 aldolase [Stutzerimonas stutzeri]RTM24137.1 aldolase [Stutzerimonas stutzeri]
MSLINRLQQEMVVGIFSKTIDSAFVEAAGLSGLDFIILDQEHGPLSLDTIHNHVRAAQITPISSIVRVKGVDSHAIGAALDSGADGVQVPNINNAEQAAAAVRAARFHPVGQRGVCRFVRAAAFGNQDKADYFSKSNEKLVILQVEGLEGIRNLDEILSVPGFDVLFVGPYDLSQSVGKPGQVDSPEVVELIQDIAKKAKSSGVLLGAFCDTKDNAMLLKNEGFRYLAYSVDMNIYMEACRSVRGLFA